MKKIFILVFMVLLMPLMVEARECTYNYSYSIFHVGSKKETSTNPQNAVLQLTIDESTGSKTVKVVKIDKDSSASIGVPKNLKLNEEYPLEEWDSNLCPLYLYTGVSKVKVRGSNEEVEMTKELEDESGQIGIHFFINQSPDSVYLCHYDGFYITHDLEGKALAVTSTIISPTISIQYFLDSSLTDQPAAEPGTCENVWTCQTMAITGSVYHYKIFSGHMDLENKKDQVCADGIFQLFHTIESEDYSKEEGDNPVCRTLNNGLSTAELLYKSCRINRDTCNIYDNYKLELKSFCSNTSTKMDYNDPCLSICFKLNQEIAKWEAEGSNDNCGLSKRLLAWIINIVKWVKYIVPAVVILLGMVDFIRGFASDKDDGVKQAQGRFVKRLIAAALIFIVPLILTFILEKMGFTANMCDINF